MEHSITDLVWHSLLIQFLGKVPPLNIGEGDPNLIVRTKQNNKTKIPSWGNRILKTTTKARRSKFRQEKHLDGINGMQNTASNSVHWTLKLPKKQWT